MSASWQLFEGDCRDTLASLPAGSVQTCVTSPPYFGLRDYAVDGQIGLEPSPDEFVVALVGVFREVRRVLRDDGTVWLNLGDSYAGSPSGGFEKGQRGGGALQGGGFRANKALDTSKAPGVKPKDLLGIPWAVAFALRADGWYLRSDIIWSKPNPMPESVTDRPTKAHEYVFLLSKSGAPTFWTHAYERRAGVRVKPTPDYWLVPQQGMTGTPHRWDGEPFDREQWRRINAWRGHDYFYDADAIREPAQDWGSRDRSGPLYDGTAGPQNGHTGLRDLNHAESGRNKRSVWTVATQPYPGTHFATFPPKLIDPCILAGCPERACGECGAPWTRVTSVEYDNPGNRTTNGPRSVERKAIPYGAAGFEQRLEKRVHTAGWEPSCRHDAPTVPGTVLDPFAGAGTTGIVALRHDRSFIGCELSPDYVRMARDRIVADAPLMNSVSEVAA